MASKAKSGGRAPGQMSLSKFFQKAEVSSSEQDGVVSISEFDYDREVSDSELEDVLQLLLGQASAVKLMESSRPRDDSQNPVVDQVTIAPTTTRSSISVPVADIGCIIKPTMSAKEICGVINKLDRGQIYKLLTGHFVPDKSYSFPKVFSAGCNRCFQMKWLEKYPWLVYSETLNGGFCKYCVLFAKDRSKLGKLVNKPFEKWVKVTKTLEGHASNSYHVNALTDAAAFIQSIEHPNRTVLILNELLILKQTGIL